MPSGEAESLTVLLQFDPEGLLPINGDNLQEYQEEYMTAMALIGDYISTSLCHLVRVIENRTGIGEIFIEGRQEDIAVMLADPVIVANNGSIATSHWQTRRSGEDL